MYYLYRVSVNTCINLGLFKFPHNSIRKRLKNEKPNVLAKESYIVAYVI